MHYLRENTARNTASTQRSVYGSVFFDLGGAMFDLIFDRQADGLPPSCTDTEPLTRLKLNYIH